MKLLQPLTTINNSCSIQIENGEFIDISNSGFFGLTKKQSSVCMKNGIISGVSCPGMISLIDNILYDAANSAKPVIYVRNRVNNQLSGNFACDIENGLLGTQAIIVDVNRKNRGINLFRGVPTLDRIADLLIEIMSQYTRMDDTMTDFSRLWYSKIFDVLMLSSPKETFRLANLRQYTFDWMKAKYDILYRTGLVHQNDYHNLIDELRNISGMYQSQMMRFSTCARAIEASGLPQILSDAETLRDIYNNNMVLLINLNDGICPKESKILLSILLQRLLMEETINPNGAVCVFENCNLKDNADTFLPLLKTVQSKGDQGSIYFTEKNISWWEGQATGVSEHPASYCNAFFVFRQNVNSDLQYWSRLSGAIKKTEITENIGPLSSVYRMEPSIISLLIGRRLVRSGVSKKEIDSYRVEETEIDSLDDNSCITIIKMSESIYCKKVSWS